ncbi:MAG: endolytic transglycosylase MltG [Candidatus Daviesbacteria bacterium]|nr:endolytic transglycosylase MltG [Candidatus Daviesbacteria bacterium]
MTKKRLVWLLVVIIIIFFIVRSFWTSQLSQVSSDQTPKDFVIAKGESFSSVLARLDEEDLIKSPLFFNIYGRLSGSIDRIQAGSFPLSPSMNAQEILKEITGQPEDLWATFLEGWRVEEMAQKLNQEFRIQNSEFLKVAKEGYMFPDTYLFPKDYTPGQIAQKLMDTFEERYDEELRSKIRNQGLTEDEGVILASIVEREARSDKARTEIAAILLKRLKIGMGLNADATLQYILVPQGSESPPAGGWWTKYLTNEDKKIDSPYNTYRYKGLPPKPIANPSLSSLQAVANADPNTPYLYYYHDSEGNSYYAKTLEEHSANVVNHP